LLESDYATGGYLIYKQKKYGKFRNQKRKGALAKRIVKKVTKLSGEVAMDYEL